MQQLLTLSKSLNFFIFLVLHFYKGPGLVETIPLKMDSPEFLYFILAQKLNKILNDNKLSKFQAGRNCQIFIDCILEYKILIQFSDDLLQLKVILIQVINYKILSQMGKLTLGYWGLRGLAQVARLLAAYVGTELNDVRYTSPQQWTEDKQKLGMQFPNLPYLIDGDFKFSESAAIYRYIIMQSGRTELLGKNAQDKGRVQNILGVLKDTVKDIRGLFWNKEYASLKDAALQKVKPKLDQLQKFIGQKKWALGYLTLADFEIAQNSYYFATLYPEQYSNWSFWQTIRQNFNSLPQIEAYYASENALIEPFLPQRAALCPKFKETVTLGYWPIRGLAHPIRLLLSYTGVNFVDKTYAQRQEYLLKDKVQLGFDFPNLPYLIEGQYKITESSALQRYVINRSNKKELLGKNVHDYIRIQQVLGVFGDIFTEVAKLFWSKDQKLIKETLGKVSPKLENLGKFVGEKNTIFEYLTLADFVVGQYSHYLQVAYPQEYKNWGFLGRIRDNINSLPSTKAYYARQGSIKGPFLPPVASLQPSYEQYQ